MAPPPDTSARKRDSAKTRDMILAAGQRLFAEKGYLATGIRDVAAEADVSPGLVMRYFGSKEGLLRTALEELLRVESMIEGSRADFGERVAAIFFQAENIPNPLGMMMLASTDVSARALCRELLDERIVKPLATWLGGADGLPRAARLNLLWMGFFAARQLIIADQSPDPGDASARNWLACMSQAIADGREVS